MRKERRKLSLIILPLVLFTSCVNLDHINNFSNTSLKTISSYKDAGYSFTYSYQHFTQTANEFDFGPAAPSIIPLPKLVEKQGEPQNAINADKAILLFLTGISSYFEGISKLSSKDLVNYNFDDLSTSIKGNSTLKTTLNLSDDKVDALSKISKVSTNGIMGVYKQKRIASIMTDYNSDLQKCIDALRSMLDNALLGSLTSDLGSLDTKYMRALNDSRLEFSTKVDLSREYTKEHDDLINSKQNIESISKALQKIGEEHDKIVNDLKSHKLSSKEIIEIVNKYSADIYLLYESIKTLK